VKFRDTYFLTSAQKHKGELLLERKKVLTTGARKKEKKGIEGRKGASSISRPIQIMEAATASQYRMVNTLPTRDGNILREHRENAHTQRKTVHHLGKRLHNNL